jgi:hypothetical protein
VKVLFGFGGRVWTVSQATILGMENDFLVFGIKLAAK